MLFHFEERPATSPYIESIWRNRSDGGGPFLSTAVSHWLMVVSRLRGRTYLTLRGPDTQPMPAYCPPDAEHTGVYFKLGVVMPHLPAANLVDGELDLPAAGDNSFWLHGASWQYPDFDNLDIFVERLVREGLLILEPVVTGALREQGITQPDRAGQTARQDQISRSEQTVRAEQNYRSERFLRDGLSLRSVQRRFLQTTGLTFQAIQQIERARRATALLQQGLSILDVVDLAGYADQPHLTRSLKRYIGQTPAQIAGKTPQAETLSFLFNTKTV